MSASDTWSQYAAVAYIVKSMEEMRKTLGKTGVQKLVYLAQELFGCPIGYQYRLYNYGPYSRQLASDQDYLEFIHAIDIEYDEDHGYSIWPGRKAQDVENRGKRFLDDWSEALDKMLSEFGKFQAWQLEIYATICFVDRDHANLGETAISLETLAEEVARIKPKHEKSFIERAVRKLHEKGFLRSCRDSSSE